MEELRQIDTCGPGVPKLYIVSSQGLFSLVPSAVAHC